MTERNTRGMRSQTIRPWLIRALRAPAVLYDWNLGWVLGRRFLRLTHRGRRSGRCYRMMLEVIGTDRARREVFVMVGLGRRAQWYRNVMAGGAVELAIGSERFRPDFRELAPAQAATVLGDYERRNRLAAPIVRAVLSRLVGWRYDGSPSARERLVGERPILAFRPAPRIQASPAPGDEMRDPGRVSEGSSTDDLVTSRLRLVPATSALISAELDDVERLGELLGAAISPDWPPEHHDADTLRFWLEALSQPGAAGWWLYYMLMMDTTTPALVGTVSYKGPPTEGTVEIGYSVVPSWQRRGLATEASRALIESARKLGVTTVIAHTLPHLEPSIGVLRKLGFAQAESSEAGVLAFALRLD